MDNPVQAHCTGGKRHGTLRLRGASLTATARRAPLKHHGPAPGEGVR
ncbi:DUF6380 family protein [Streptomyces sp. CRN 30]